MRLPFFRAAKPASPAAAEPTRAPRGKAAVAGGGAGAGPGTARDTLGLSSDGAVQAARTRARRRLMGAGVLLAMGVLGFPILFETQPRPLPVDTPMLLPEGAGRKAVSAATVPLPPALPPDAGLESGSAGAAAAAPSVAPASLPVPVPVPTPAPSASASASRPAAQPTPVVALSAPAAASKAAAPAALQAPVQAAVQAPVQAASKPTAKPIIPAAAPAAKPSPQAAPAGTERFVVQVGAYNDAERLRAARQNLEKLGFKSYTQEVETATGKRTRVRVGPFPTRKEADAVATKVKANGMQANILAL